jgi:two-component system LytT family response regulator
VIRALIVDDEELGRESLRIRLQRESDLKIVGEASDGQTAVRLIRKLAPELVFLDIKMPRVNGFDVLERLGAEKRPYIVFVTEYVQYAAKAFEAHAVDYLLKTISKKRFDEAIRRVRSALAATEVITEESAMRAVPDTPEPSWRIPALRRFVVKTGDKFQLLKLEQIDWIDSAANYVRLHVRGHEFLVRSSMDELETQLDQQQFRRIHRSCIVNIDRIREIRPTANGDFDVQLQDHTVLRLSRGYRERLLPKATRQN